ncbi:MAG: antitoxin component YwqK of YwqJK toxin-antitoxin module [Parvicella sp.]|jgi:antitoxin component YwqK of YwqJK toxin-antitoxin module
MILRFGTRNTIVMNYFLLFISFMFGFTVFGQTQVADTVYVNRSSYQLSKSFNFFGEVKATETDTLYYLNGDYVEKLTYEVMKARADSIPNYYYNSYCKFYRDGITLCEEGIWMMEFFRGPYKNYYKNGQLMSKGVFDKRGMPIGTWEYHNKRGKVKIVKY